MILSIALVLLFFLLLIPYRLYDSVQLSYFLHAFHQSDPQFLKHDWFTTQTPTPHPFFAWWIASLHSLNLLPPGLFLIWVTQIALLLYGIFRLCNLFSSDSRLPCLVSFMLLFYFSDGLGQSTLFSAVVQPTDMAMPFYLLSLLFFFEERMALAGMFLGLAGLLHIHLGLNGLLVFILLWFFFHRAKNLPKMVGGLLLFFLCISPNLIPILQNFSLFDSADHSEILKVFFNFRSPHHYRPSTFQLAYSLRVFFPLFFLWEIKPKPDRLKVFLFSKTFVAVVSGLCLLAAVSTEIFYLPGVALLFPFRLSPFLLLFGLVGMSYALLERLESKEKFGALLAGLIFFLVYFDRDSRLFFPLALFTLVNWKLERAGRWSAVSLLLTFIFIASSFLMTHRVDELIFCGLLAFLSVAILRFLPTGHISQLVWTVCLWVLPALAFHLFFPNRISFHSIQTTPPPALLRNNPPLWQALDWIKKQTEREAVFLTPPHLSGVRFFAERAIVVDFHANPYGSRALKEWKERLEAVTHTSDLEKWIPLGDSVDPQIEFLRNRFLSLKPSAIENIARRYGARYFLTEAAYPYQKELVEQNHSLIFQNSSYLVFRLRDSF